MLRVGTKLGPYEIASALGCGGMGEVYRATDTRLRRDVALKFLPEAFARDSERMARFDREAKVLASLNHPCIAHVYGVEESNSTRALVMELVEGPTLAERIKQGPLPLDDALPIAIQIADGLEYAHERGIIHRDLKPSNIKLTPDGQVKILDFGLAKALEGDAASADISRSPTISRLATQAGIILGTAAYMSPEQAKGKTVDRRADIWAFGCVLYEMLTGKPAFDGETVTDVLAAVVRAEPDWSRLPSSVPPRARELMSRCLRKDTKQRLRDIGEARIALEETLTGSVGEPASEHTRKSKLSFALWGAGGLVLGILIAGAIFTNIPRQSAPPATRRLSVSVPAGQFFENALSRNIAVSADGTQVAYVLNSGPAMGASPHPGSAASQIWIRRLDDFEARPLPGTDGGDTPFFSPDGKWLAFYINQKLMKVPVAGGPPQTIASADGPYEVTWAWDDNLYWGDQFNGIYSVASSGGDRRQVIAPNRSKSEVTLIQPQLLPGGEAMLYTAIKGFSLEQSTIEAVWLKTGNRQMLVQNATSPRYVAPGYLVFARAGTLWEVPFDTKYLKITGIPVQVISGIAHHSSNIFEQFDLTYDGLLVYAPGSAAEAQRDIVECDRQGHERAVTVQHRAYEDLSLSPDGHRLAVTIEGPEWNVWTYDLQRNTLTRLTFEGNNNKDPFWSADGKRVVYSSLRNGEWSIYVKAADGTGSEEKVFGTNVWTVASSFSPDGKYLAFFRQEPGQSTWILPLADSGKPYVFLEGPFTVSFPKFSPDGRWIAYESNESGSAEVYVKAFSGTGGKWQVSNQGGSRPIWPRSDNEIFFMSGSKLMTAPIQTSPAFSAGNPRPLFEGEFLTSGGYYDASPDGKYFYFIKTSGQTGRPAQINVVLNWTKEFNRAP